MQLNYSHLKILKLKIHSLFLVTLYCAHVTWWHFTNLTIGVFSISFFLNTSPQVLPLISVKSSLNWPKIWNGLLLQKKITDFQVRKLCYRHKDIYLKQLNNCVYMTLTNSKFAIIPSGFDKFKYFAYDSSSVTMFF